MYRSGGGHTFFLSDAEFRTCFTVAHSLWPAPFPPLSPQAMAHQGLCSRASQVVRSCPTSCDRALPSCLMYSRHGPLRHLQRSIAGSPGSRARDLHACSDLRPRRVRLPLALARQPMLPSAYLDGVGTLDRGSFRGSIPGLHAPCQRLASVLTDANP